MADEKTAKYKIDVNNSWCFDYAVYKLGIFGFWWKVYDSNSLAMCEDHVQARMNLPKYY